MLATMGGYGQFCPVAQASEVLAERWTPLVLRELIVGGATRFNDIHRGVPLMSSTLLSKRLRSLERAGVIERRRLERGGTEYVPTRAGEELAPVIELMGSWSERWLRRPVTPEDADPAFLMWTVRTVAEVDEMPPERRVAHFRFPRAPDKLRYWWLVMDPPDLDVCLTDPGFGVDLTVTSSPETLASVILGDIGMASALKSGAIELRGPTEMTRGFRRWFGLSPFAALEHPPERARALADP
jgi:DNA-binding HxlR family transcriptional regulator